MSGTPRTALVGITSVALLTAGVAAIASGPAQAAAASATVSTLADSGPGSLRAAIELANAGAPGFVIQFGVAGRIPLNSALPAVTNDVDVDATSAPGYTAGAPPPSRSTTTATADWCSPKGRPDRACWRFRSPTHPATVSRSDPATSYWTPITSGLTPAGAAAGNGGDGLELASGSSDNLIGQNTAGVSGATSNVISGNGASGIRLVGSSRNTIVTNRIGTDPTDPTSIPNADDGLTLTNKSSGNTIGGRVFTDSATGETNNPTGTKGSTTPVFVVPPPGNQVSGTKAMGSPSARVRARTSSTATSSG